MPNRQGGGGTPLLAVDEARERISPACRPGGQRPVILRLDGARAGVRRGGAAQPAAGCGIGDGRLCRSPRTTAALSAPKNTSLSANPPRGTPLGIRPADAGVAVRILPGGGPDGADTIILQAMSTPKAGDDGASVTRIGSAT